jgi:hypothetical protein
MSKELSSMTKHEKKKDNYDDLIVAILNGILLLLNIAFICVSLDTGEVRFLWLNIMAVIPLGTACALRLYMFFKF